VVGAVRGSDRARRGAAVRVVTPRVSIVLVTRNGAATLPAVLDRIAEQRFDGAVELIAVDSESTDGTADLLRGRVHHLITIPVDAFDHGLTRNLGIERAQGEFIVLLVQDAVPANDRWLAELIAPLVADPRVAGSFARQSPAESASAITRHYHARWAAASATPRISELSGPAEFAALDPAARLERCTFDDVCSCVRRSVWMRCPFQKTPFAEDLEWARTVLLEGYRIAYAPASVVIHSHDRSARYEYARTRILHQRLYQLFGLRTIPSLAHLIRAILSSIALHWRCEPGPRGLALAIAWPAGQYFGARAAVRGEPR
jgi:rhamnosyltransferase